MKRIYVAGALLALSPMSFAEGTAWLPAPGDTSVSLSHVFQTADEFYVAKDKNELPDDLEQQTTWLSVTHGLTEDLALDFKTGYARSTFDPVPESHLTGRTDTHIGLSWRFVDEFVNDAGLPSLAIRAAGIIEGTYKPGAINSIGDGADGVEVSLIGGKFINSWLALNGEIGYRNRASGVPEENFYKASAFLFPVDNLVASVSYSFTDARDGRQLNDPTFSPDQFPLLEEDTAYAELAVSYRFTDQISAGLNAGQVVDGRNTAKSDVFGITLSITH